MPQQGYRNELLDEWVGGIVLMGLLYPPVLSREEADAIREDPNRSVYDAMRSMTAIYRFVAYDEIGVTLRQAADGDPYPPPMMFVPWAAVLRLESIEEPEDAKPAQG